MEENKENMKAQRIIDEDEYQRLLKIEGNIVKLINGEIQGFKLREWYHNYLPHTEFIVNDIVAKLSDDNNALRNEVWNLKNELEKLKKDKPKSFLRKLLSQ